MLLVTGSCVDRPMAPDAVDPGSLQRLIVPSPGFIQVSSGNYFSCGLRSDGTARCWGGLAIGHPETLVAATGTLTQISAGGAHTCGLRSDGVVQCWGVNTQGQAPATRQAQIGSFLLVSAGDTYTCAIRSDFVVECWGTNGFGEAPATRTPRLPYMDLSPADGANCGVFLNPFTSGGAVDCWGADDMTIDASDNQVFVQVATLPVFAESEMCALRTDGVVECVTFNDGRILGRIERTAATGGFQQVTVGKIIGADFGCALRGDGAIQCWGSFGAGLAPPLKTALSGGFSQVAGGGQHACGLRLDGAIECWGLNHLGQAPALVTDTILPTATFTVDAAVDEGSPFTMTLNNGQVPGYDGSPFRYFLYCGGFSTFETTTLTCPTFFGPEDRIVVATVRDRDGQQRSYVDTVRIRNVAPTVAPLGGATLLVTETYATTGSFTDPGPFDTHTASANYGDGTGSIAAPVTGTAFALDHQYMTAGVFTVTADVTDSDGGSGQATGTVTVISMAAFTSTLQGEIAALLAARRLTDSQAKALNTKLTRMLNELSGGRTISAARFIELFRKQVENLVADATLTPAEAASLLAGADRIAMAIQAM